jgi:Zn-dependent protease with chaperone function
MFFFSPVLHFTAAWLMTVVANWVGLIAWRRAADAHWTERARLLYPARLTAIVNILLIPLILNELHIALFPETAFARSWISDAIAAFLGALLGCYYLDHETFPQLKVAEWLFQVIAAWGIRFFIFLPAVAAILLMPVHAGPTMLFVTAAYLAVHFAIQGGLLLRCLRLIKILKPASIRLKGIVDEVAAQAGVAVRATWQFGATMANAFAFPFSGELAFSDRLLEICTDEEISAIATHEMAHLGEPKAVLAGRLIGSLYLLPLIFMAPLTYQLAFPAGPILPVLGMIAIRGFSVWLTRRMEKRADRLASTTTINEGAYAGALEKIYRENQFPAASGSKRRTHPDLYDRMLQAGVTPDYPRPGKPKSITPIGWLYVFACIVATIAATRS